MANTRSVYFSGKIIETTVTDKASIADAWVVDISSIYGGQKIVVGLDSEWRPHPNRDMDNTTAVLQLCVDTKCLIVQMFFMDYIPESLKNFLSDPNATFVGVEVARDVAKLKNEYGLECSSIADVRDLTLKRWPYVFYRKPGLKDVFMSLPIKCPQISSIFFFAVVSPANLIVGKVIPTVGGASITKLLNEDNEVPFS